MQNWLGAKWLATQRVLRLELPAHRVQQGPRRRGPRGGESLLSEPPSAGSARDALAQESHGPARTAQATRQICDLHSGRVEGRPALQRLPEACAWHEDVGVRAQLH
eukprot:8724709-Pyramimonas_sp.AAC.1